VTIPPPPSGALPEPAAYMLSLGQHILAGAAESDTGMPVIIRFDRGPSASLLLSLPPDHMYDAVQAMPTAFGADVIALVFDSYRSELENDPRTGQPWRSGAMTEVAELGDGIAAGTVEECLNLCYAERTPAGDTLTRVWSFGYERRSDGLHWTTGIDPDSDQTDDPNALTAAGALPSAMAEGLRIAVDWKPDADRFTLDRFAAMLAQREYGAHVWMQGGAPS
jgi:hypothetical protein